MGYYGLVLEHDGQVFPCVNCEEAAFGSLLKQRFRDIWWSRETTSARRRMRAECCSTCPSICYTLPDGVSDVARLTWHRLRRNRVEWHGLRTVQSHGKTLQ
jgi:MoaA/NifB/PqqE/SkfB family radical SAM enzyme